MCLPAFGKVRTWAGVGEKRRLCEQGDVNRGTMGWTCEGRTVGLALLWPGAREEITRKSRVSYRAHTFKLAPSGYRAQKGLRVGDMMRLGWFSV